MDELIRNGMQVIKMFYSLHICYFLFMQKLIPGKLLPDLFPDQQ